MQTMWEESANPPSLEAARPRAIVDAVFARERRALLVGAPGSGKSTLIDALAQALGEAGRACWCIGADPGSPRFGVPGAVCLGRWEGGAWRVEEIAALCTLDAGRFRLPLVAAVTRLARRVEAGTLLLDAPGVVRGVGGAELVTALAAAAGIDAVLVLARPGAPVPLAAELAALPAEVVALQAAAAARRPGKRVRARRRTALWDAHLAAAGEQCLDLRRLHLVGTPPPRQAPAAWRGRQVALLAGERTVALGEVCALEGDTLRVRSPVDLSAGGTLLIRDAARAASACLESAAPFAAEPLVYAAPQRPEIGGGPRVLGRAGMLDFELVNGVFGDPLLHLRLRHARRSLLFDLGEGARLAARIAHQVSDVFVTHCHFDHIAGFLWLLRSRIGDFPPCRLYGPPGLAARIDGFAHGVLWDRIADRGPCFEVGELHGARLRRYAVQAGRPGPTALDEQAAPGGVLLAEPGFQVRAVTVDHGTPVLAFAFEPVPQINVRKDRLRARGLAPGPWLGALKRHLLAGEDEAPVTLPDGHCAPAAALGADLVLVSPGKRLVYATDFCDTAANRERLVALARGAHTLFCEATFRQRDAGRAARNAHITTRACAEIAEAAGVARLVPFHFSRRYEHAPQGVYEEIAAICPRTAVPGTLADEDKEA